MADNAELGIEEIHSIELKMLHYLDDVCKKNGIRYCLVYGTALGSVRHSGFIPWDDDVDVGIVDADLDFLSSIVNQDDSHYRILSCFDDTTYSHPYAKLVDTMTYLEEPTNKPVEEMGVFIDLFPLMFLPDRGLMKRVLLSLYDFKLKLYCYKFVRRKEAIREGSIPKRFAYILSQAVFPKNEPEVYLDKLLKKIRHLSVESGPFVFSLLDNALIYPSSSIFPIRENQFCDAAFAIPGEPDTYLRIAYGDDYMTPLRTEFANHGNAILRKDRA